MISVQFDPTIAVQNGYFRCNRCGVESYDSRFDHRPGCEGGGDTTYCYGPKEIERVKGLLESFGLAYFLNCWAELQILRNCGAFQDREVLKRLLKDLQERLSEANITEALKQLRFEQLKDFLESGKQP